MNEVRHVVSQETFQRLIDSMEFSGIFCSCGEPIMKLKTEEVKAYLGTEKEMYCKVCK